MMRYELEAVALRLFEARGFGDVTVEQIASAAQSSQRTFYRYFPTKEDVLQVHIDRRSSALRAALLARPADEPPLHSLRLAYAEVVAAEDIALHRRWTDVVFATPNVLRGVVGGAHLKTQTVIAGFFGARLGLPPNDLVPTMLAAAAGGVVQAAHAQWYLLGVDLPSAISDALGVLERGIGPNPDIWLARTAPPTAE
jgi:AcrR family transcriptional regulator